MPGKKLFLFIILFSLVIRLYFVFVNVSQPDYLKSPTQQDNYLGYAASLEKGTIDTPSYADSRFFPWYPATMVIMNMALSIPLAYSGLLINAVSLVGSIIIFWQLTKDKIATIIFAYLPPFWFLIPVKLATEPLTVFLLLLSLALYLKKKYFLSGIILGFATGVRLIAAALILALCAVSYKEIKQKLLPAVSGFMATLLLLAAYNIYVFHNLFYQFMLYPKIGGASGSSVAFIQIFKDILRAASWHQYRILISGVSYVLFSLICTFILYKFRKKSLLFNISFFWCLFSLIFIFTLGPDPLLEEFRRFLIPFLPALIIAIMAPVNVYKKYLNKFFTYARKI